MRTIIVGKKRIQLDEPVDAICKCGKRVVFGYFHGNPASVHEAPDCLDYRSRDPLEFIEWLNMAKGNKYLH